MKNTLYFILGFVLCFLLLKQCNTPKAKEKPVQGNLVSEPHEIHHFKTDTIYIEKFTSPEVKTIYKDVVKKQDRIVTNFINLPCEEKDSVFLEETKLKGFEWSTEDENLMADIRGLVRGSVEHIEIFYLIKPEKSNLYLNLNASTNREMNALSVGAGVRFKNYSITAQRVNGQNFYGFGYDFKLF